VTFKAMGFKVVIPARYASARLPGKPLLDIHGKPMIAWVIAAACASDADEVYVATDDTRIVAAIAGSSRATAMMTREDHRSGTDRIAEVAAYKHWSADTIVVNVQGDEPQMPVALINQVANLLITHPKADIATLCTPVLSLAEFLNTNVVKVVKADNDTALYFSRAPIPWHRDSAAGGLNTQTQFNGAQRHLGIYAYRVGALKQLTQLAAGALEVAENLEQLRAMQAGMRIVVANATVQPGQGVDTPEDIARVRTQN
jgi:3-deoxy-manno-octulosonate cytidylyltransferase (CMP-KDO synthetase)